MTELRGFKFVTALVLVLKKIESDYETEHDIFYSHSNVETVFNESDIDDIFESIYTTVTSNKQNIFRKRFRLDYWFGHGE